MANNIKEEHKIYTACGDGKSPFVAAADIAACAFQLLTAPTPPVEQSYRILGPQLLSYDDVSDVAR